MRAPKGLFAVGVLRTLGALALVLVFTLPGSVSALAQSSMALPSSESPASGTDRLVAHYALGFRGDRSLDLATVVEEAIAPSTLYIVQLQLSSGAEQSIAVAAPPGGLQLEMRDMTGDRVPNDLVLTPTLLRWPLTVLVNDGNDHFTVAISAPPPGSMQSREDRVSGTRDLHDATALPSCGSKAGGHPSGVLLPPKPPKNILSPTTRTMQKRSDHDSRSGRAPPSFAPQL